MQDESEEVWLTKMSFTITTRDDVEDETVEREYTFSWGKEFDEWHLYEYRERRRSGTGVFSEGDWETERHVWWDSAEEPDIDVPQKVTKELRERLGSEEVRFVL